MPSVEPGVRVSIGAGACPKVGDVDFYLLHRLERSARLYGEVTASVSHNKWTVRLDDYGEITNVDSRQLTVEVNAADTQETVVDDVLDTDDSGSEVDESETVDEENPALYHHYGRTIREIEKTSSVTRNTMRRLSLTSAS